MKRRGLVLGGGGLVGVAWERGLIQGLAEGGADLREADVIVGTSAGSLIGSQLAAGLDFTNMPPGSILPAPPMAEGGVDTEAATAVMSAWTGMDAITVEGCVEVGRHALRARTASQEAWIAATGGGLDLGGWPDKDLRISVVDARKGERKLFDRRAGVPFEAVIAASCAVPGLFPTIEIAGEPYMDGGVWSGTHADALVADALDHVFVIAPLIEGVVAFGRQMDQALRGEIAALDAAGCGATCVLPEAADREAFGPNMMDPARTDSVLAFARARGRALAGSSAFPW